MDNTHRECRKCGKTKPLDAFVKNARYPEGREYRCRECRGDYLKAWAATEGGSASLKAYRVRRRDKSAEASRRYRRNNPEAVARATARWQAKNPDRRAAHIAVGNAIRDGRIVRKPCEKCGREDRVDAHHDDYSKPLEVRWLCHACHISTEHTP